MVNVTRTDSIKSREANLESNQGHIQGLDPGNQTIGLNKYSCQTHCLKDFCFYDVLLQNTDDNRRTTAIDRFPTMCQANLRSLDK